jgi:predicted nucleic acid-binding protein
MTSIVVDASVALAWYLSESFSGAAHVWRSKLDGQQFTFIVPQLHYWEFANALRTKIRRKILDAGSASVIWKAHLAAPLHMIDPSREDVLATALEYDATAYDAVYITLALELDAPLLTAERATTPWVKKLGARAISIAALPS